jgi:RNA polymerase sigma-70 factor (ECF subfamily)
MAMDEVQPTFDALFARNWKRVAAVLARMLGDSDEAEDLALEVFYRLHERMDGSNTASVADGWLFRVATNLGLNALRARKRRQAYEREAGFQSMLTDQPSPPAVEVEKREEHRQVRVVLAEIRPLYARLLILRASGLSYQELGEVLRIRANSVGTLLNRAERDFERRYHKRFGERSDDTP